MADLDLPETQPSRSGRGKQVFFLFMSAVVIAVVIFLLGVSVGRGVRKASPPVDAGDAGDTTVAATPSVKTSPSDLSYHDALQRPPAASDPGKSAAPAAPVTPPAAPPSSVIDAPPPTKDAAAGAPAKPAASTTTAKPAPGAKTEYSIQVGAFRTVAAAQSQVAQVKARDKSYPVSMLTLPESEPGPRFKVVVGPYPTLEDANRAAARLRGDGFGVIIKH